MAKKIEKRCFEVQELRATEAEGKRSISGYAAMFERQSENLGIFRTIYEKIRAGAFARTLRDGADVRAFWNHNTDIILGRRSAETLKLEEDATGLRFELDLPDTQAGRDAFVSVQRRDVTGMSFGFEVIKEERHFPEDPKEPIIRTLVDIELFEVSPVAFPAYPDTSVGTRSLDAWALEQMADVEKEQKLALAAKRGMRLLQRERDAKLQAKQFSPLAWFRK